MYDLAISRSEQLLLKTRVPHSLALNREMFFRDVPLLTSDTGHGFRSSSTTVLALDNVCVETLKRHIPWKLVQYARGTSKIHWLTNEKLEI